MTSTPRPRVDHLKAGDHAVLLFEGGVRVECDLVTDSAGGLYTADGGLEVLVRWSDGTPNGLLIEVVSPEAPPSEPLPVGQVRINPDGEIVAVRFDEDHAPWNCSDGLDRWDDGVRDWHVMIREDDPRVMPEGHVAVDLSYIPSTSLRRWIKSGVHVAGWFLGDVARAELARRGESA